jgi:hypothetical protein
MRRFLPLCLALLVGDARADPAWRELAPGLALARFAGPPNPIGDATIKILRIDPARYELRLMNASAPGEGRPRTAREWAARAGAVAAINAAMYLDDQRTSVSMMHTGAHVNQNKLSKDKAVLAFEPRDRKSPPVALLDRECDDLDAAARRYATLVQSIRMVSCRGAVNTWAQSSRRWSTAAIGIDGAGRVLFIHTRSPYSVHDLIEHLKTLPIGLARAMYVEGGPEAQLAVRAGHEDLEFVGSYETGFIERDDNDHAWPVPNVVVAVPRAR